MPVPNNVPAIAPVNGLTPPPLSPLQKLIDQLKKEGVTLELIISLIMSNPEGIGAMDITSQSIAGITQQSKILSEVQSDIITLNSILSKIESQLGYTNNITQGMWAKLPPKLMQQFQSTYEKLFKSDAANPGGVSDLAYLKTFEKSFPSLDPLLAGVTQWEGMFNQTIPNSGSPNTFEKDIFSNNTQWGGNFANDVVQLAKDHYNANHQNPGSGSTTTDYLQDWWSNGNTNQQFASGQSQQDTTQVQSYMQLLQGFDNSAQQDLQLSSTQKSQMIQNQKAS